jgi:hypothetical protein
MSEKMLFLRTTEMPTGEKPIKSVTALTPAFLEIDKSNSQNGSSIQALKPGGRPPYWLRILHNTPQNHLLAGGPHFRLWRKRMQPDGSKI